MRLTSSIGLVGGGNFGFNLSHPVDCHVYLLDGGDDLALVDAGVGGGYGGTEMILRNLRADGYPVDRISTLILTHYHGDHAGGAAEFRDRLGLRVIGTPTCAAAVSTADLEAISLRAAIDAGIYPDDFQFAPCPTDGTLTEGASFTVGNLKVTPYDTPGHSAGHSSLLVEGGDRVALVGGDLVFHGGTIISQNIHDCSLQDYAASMAKVGNLQFEALLPGHLAISLQDGKRHVDAANAVFDKLGIPRNAV